MLSDLPLDFFMERFSALVLALLELSAAGTVFGTLRFLVASLPVGSTDKVGATSDGAAKGFSVAGMLVDPTFTPLDTPALSDFAYLAA
jgi:hypothetical protein